MNVFVDIETIPAQPEAENKALIAQTIQAPAQMSKPETIAAWHAGEGAYAGVKDLQIEAEYRKLSFDGARGEIISVSFACDDGLVSTFTSNNIGERQMLETFLFDLSVKLNGKNPFFIGHNVVFDLKFLFHRCVIHSLNPMIDFKQWGKHSSQFYDTMTAWAGYGNRISQDNLCKALGIDGKPSDITGANVYDHYKAGNIDRIAEYNAEDVKTVRKIYNRLNFIF